MNLSKIKNQFVEKGFTTYISPELRKVGILARAEYFKAMSTLPLHSQNEKIKLEN